MSTSSTISKRCGKVARKAARIAKRKFSPAYRDVIVSGKVDNEKRTFRFKVISEKQQLNERNNAYQFFSVE